MTEPQFRALFAEAKQRSGAGVLTRSLGYHLERAAGTHSDGDMKTIPFKINPQALISPGVTSSNVLITKIGNWSSVGCHSSCCGRRPRYIIGT